MKRLVFCVNLLSHNKSSAIDNVVRLIVKSVIFTLLFVSIGLNTNAQIVFEFSSKLAAMKASGNLTAVNEAAHINSLVTDMQPTVYVSDVVNASGVSLPVRADVKAGAVSNLSIANPLFAQVELITIRINSQADLSTTIDLSSIQGFTNLKYVRLLCSFNCTAVQLGAIVTGNNTGIVVFYSISIPS